MTPTMATTGRATADLHGESVASRGLSGKIRGMAPVCANGFCDRSWMRSADIFIENEWCVFVASDDDDIRTRAQLHLGVLPGLPRFDDEPMAAAGIRTGINVPDNVRPDPYRPGAGRALLGV